MLCFLIEFKNYRDQWVPFGKVHDSLPDAINRLRNIPDYAHCYRIVRITKDVVTLRKSSK